MANKLKLVVPLMVIFLTGCGGGGGELPVVSTGPVVPPPSPPSPPLYSKPGYFYHGLLWGSMAGTEYLYSSSRCVFLETLAVAGFCVDPITQDGTESAGATLRTGQIIELNAGFNGGTGAAIDIQRTIVGPIESIDADHLHLTVLGQKVYVTDQTQGDPFPPSGNAFDFASVVVGDYVAVSGHFTRDGQVLATLIETYSGTEPLLLRGVLTAQTADSYRIGGQLVDFSSAETDGFENGMPISGDTVLVLAGAAPENGVLVAQTLKNAGSSRDAEAQQGRRFLLDGFVTANRGGGYFDIAGYRFNYSTWDCKDCAFVSDSTVGKLASYSNDHFGTTFLNLKPPTWNGTYVIGPISGVDPSGESLTIAGFAVQTNPATVISTGVEPLVSAETLQLADLAVGDIVTVTGGVRLVPGVQHWLPDDRMVAGSIAPGGDSLQVHTQLYERADPNIVFLGRNIVTDAATTVTACDGDGVCIETTPAWLFENTDYFRPVVTIDVEPGSDPLRAANILAIRDL